MSRIPEFLEALEKMKEVHIKKNEDYASDSNPFSNFDCSEYGLSLFKNPRDGAFAWPIFTKLARLSTLLNSNKEPNNESVEDSFIDIANYVLLWRADFIRRKKYQHQMLVPEAVFADPNPTKWEGFTEIKQTRALDVDDGTEIEFVNGYVIKSPESPAEFYCGIEFVLDGLIQVCNMNIGHTNNHTSFESSRIKRIGNRVYPILPTSQIRRTK